MACNEKAAQFKQIACFDDRRNPIGTVTAIRIPCVAPAVIGHRWQLRVDALYKPWPDCAGIYEWRILNARNGGGDEQSLRTALTGRPLAVYVGQATRFKDRLPQYWRDMSPQLVEHRNGSTAITARGVRRREKNRLRWIHFWLAWAFVEEAPVELILRASSNNLTDAETERITAVTGGAGNPGRCVNKEALGAGSVYVYDVIEAFRKLQTSAPTHIPVPTNWSWHYGTCYRAKPWIDAIDAWARQHNIDFP